VLTLALACPLVLASCGGTRQDASEPSGTFDISIVKASFPSRQALAAPTTLEISVRNDGTRPVPDVAVTVNSFNCRSSQSGLADPTRPVWIVDSAPVGGQTAYTDTWALGSLPSGATRTFVWNVTPVVASFNHPFTITYRVAAGLNGKARAQLTGGGIPEGSFRVSVAGQAPQSRVDPNTGRVIRSAPAIASPGRHSARPSTGSPSCVPAPGYGSQGAASQQPGTGSGSQPGG